MGQLLVRAVLSSADFECLDCALCLAVTLYRGLLVMWQSSYHLAKALNSSETFCGPLSLQSVSGIPYRENIALRAAMFEVDVDKDSLGSGRNSP